MHTYMSHGQLDLDSLSGLWSRIADADEQESPEGPNTVMPANTVQGML